MEQFYASCEEEIQYLKGMDTMIISFIKRYRYRLLGLICVAIILVFYLWVHWYGYLILSREDKQFVRAAMSGVKDIEFESLVQYEKKGVTIIRLFPRHNRITLEEYNHIRENMNEYLSSHPEWGLLHNKIWVEIVHMGSQKPLLAFYNYDKIPDSKERWDTLLSVSIDHIDHVRILNDDSLLCLSDCKRVELDFVPQNCEIFRQFSNLEYLVLGKSLTEEKKEELQKMLPNTDIYSQ